MRSEQEIRDYRQLLEQRRAKAWAEHDDAYAARALTAIDTLDWVLGNFERPA